MLSFKPSFSLSSFSFIKSLFSSSSFCHKGGVICVSEVIDVSPIHINPVVMYMRSIHDHWKNHSSEYTYTHTHPHTYTHGGGTGLISGLGRSPGEGNGNPLQYSCPKNPMDRGSWQATVQRLAQLDTTEQLSTDTHICLSICSHLYT